MISPQLGLNYELTGRWEHHPTWGKTFVFSTNRIFYPTTIEAIRSYLEENAKWVGPEISKRIVDAYGSESLSILKNDPERIAKEIKGISPDRAAEISAMLRKLEDGERLEIELNTILGGTRVSRRSIQRIIQLWGENAPEIIRSDPYRMIDAIDGIGFLIADDVAKKNGFDLNGFPRIRAGILFILKEEAWGPGHTFLPKDLLLQKAQELLSMQKDTIASSFQQLELQGDIVIQDSDIYLKGLYCDEKSVARTIQTLLKTNDEPSNEPVSGPESSA